MIKKGIRISLNIKTALKTAILTLFLGLFLFNVALASYDVPFFYDDFNSYNLGDLVGQGNWIYEAYSSSPQVQTEQVHSGKAIKFTSGTGAGKSGTAEEEGVLKFWFLFPSTGGSLWFEIFNPNRSAFIELNFSGNSIYDYRNLSEPLISGISSDVWHIIFIEFSKSNNRYRIKIDDGNWTDYKTLINIYDTPSYLGFWCVGGSFYLDDINGFITGIGGVPDVFPTNPPDEAETIVDWASTTFSGQVKIPNEYEGTCYQMDIKLMAWAECLVSGTSTQIISFNLGNLKKNQTFDYSTTTAIQIASSSCPYLSVSYIISCVRNNELEQFYHWKNAYIKYSAEIPSPTLAPYITELPTPTAEVSCDDYSGIDKFICEIRNFFAGLFTPSPEKILNLKQKIETLKTQFPANYISKTKDFFDDLNNQLSEDIPVLAFTIPFSTSTQNVDFQFWQASISFAGLSQTILTIFKTFFTGFFILIFVAWAINFIKRIL